MRPRQTLVEIFSTFVQFDGDRFSGWARDAQQGFSVNNYAASLFSLELFQNPVRPYPSDSHAQTFPTRPRNLGFDRQALQC